MMIGKCPSCGGLVTTLNVYSLDGNCEGGPFKSLTLNCPLCNVVLGCQIDAVAIADQLMYKIDNVAYKIDSLSAEVDELSRRLR